MNRYCVYVHERLDTGAPFYVGKGTSKRWKSASGRSTYWQRVAAKNGWKPRKIADNMPEPCAFSLERALIACHRESLCNLTDGGEGTSGRVPSVAQRRKCSASNKGKTPSAETKAAAIARNSKPIGTRCGLRFSSMSEAVQWLGLGKAAKVNISQVARGKTGSAYGYEWGFLLNGEPVFLYKSAMSRPRPKRWRAVQCVDAGVKFESVGKAVDWLRANGRLKANTGAVCRSAKFGVSMYGMVWSYV